VVSLEIEGESDAVFNQAEAEALFFGYAIGIQFLSTTTDRLAMCC